MGLDLNFIYKEETVSTSTDVRELIEKGAGEGTVVVANRQSGGRGRRGKSFFSPDSVGLYFSALFCPQFTACDATFITTAAAVATAKAIEEICGRKCGIKWVNDLYFKEKKVCGILCEAVMSGDKLYIILGIGINLLPPDNGFPEEIKNIAGSIFEKGENINDAKKLLPQKILDNFYKYYKNFEDRAFIEEYKNYSIMSGKKITVIKENGSFEATALGVDDECRLVIENSNGTREVLSSGEISIKFN